MQLELDKVILVKPRGFCAGVVRAIEIVERALDALPHPIYVRKEIVHNRHVVDDLRQRGAVFVQSLEDVPIGATVVFSAHGVSPSVRQQARRKRLRVIDATCPLVNKVHAEARRYAQRGYSIILIGHKGHEEIEGTMGEAPHCTFVISSVEEVDELNIPHPDRVVYLTQTTLSMDDAKEIVTALKHRFPNLESPSTEDICYATQNRQMAVKLLARIVDIVFVVGASNSSNAQRLCEVARAVGAPAFLISDADDIDLKWLIGKRTVGITAGASTPEYVVQSVVHYLRSVGAKHVEEIEAIHEEMRFPLPHDLMRILQRAQSLTQ